MIKTLKGEISEKEDQIKWEISYGIRSSSSSFSQPISIFWIIYLIIFQGLTPKQCQ